MIAFTAGPGEIAQKSLSDLVARYGQTDVTDAKVIVALGGDGFVLETLHDTQGLGLPVYGMNRGTIGFLMNEF